MKAGLASLALAVAAMLLAPAPAWSAAPRIDRPQVEQMFADIKSKTDWDVSKDMLWGYFFLNATRAPLDKAAPLLTAKGYKIVDIRKRDGEEGDPAMWELHVEKIETHTIDSLNARNQEFYRFAAEQGLESYDGMDVGIVPPVH